MPEIKTYSELFKRVQEVQSEYSRLEKELALKREEIALPINEVFNRSSPYYVGIYSLSDNPELVCVAFSDSRKGNRNTSRNINVPITLLDDPESLIPTLIKEVDQQWQEVIKKKEKKKEERDRKAYEKLKARFEGA